MYFRHVIAIKRQFISARKKLLGHSNNNNIIIWKLYFVQWFKSNVVCIYSCDILCYAAGYFFIDKTNVKPPEPIFLQQYNQLVV